MTQRTLQDKVSKKHFFSPIGFPGKKKNEKRGQVNYGLG
jgi:hypothetical protein